MKTISIDGVECVTLHDISIATGLSVDALRQRQARGTLTLEPHVSISGAHFYAVGRVRALFQGALSG